ncbi:VOC family protein [Dietzia lutea]|uniref:VOC domain-containing protein n=1 Tax=Dietzia lutea TaxID=546160 RepID=A0A2S1R9V8_9ACTN|nr:VOC family protein [Dietzia lutea]AWH93078.1 hypothetical protein A6035_13870 [Dietzia lutea]
MSTESIETAMVVGDARACAAFYRDVLGFEVTREVDLPTAMTDGLGLGDGGRLIWVTAPDGSVVKFFDGGGRRYRPPTQDESGYAHHFITLYVRSLRATLERAQTAGAATQTEPVAVPNGNTICFLRDPAGHTLELIERPANPRAAAEGRR